MSCVRASDRGEALWPCEIGVFVNAGPQNGEMSGSGRVCGLAVCAAMCKGFKEKFQILLLCATVFRNFGDVYGYVQWF